MENVNAILKEKGLTKQQLAKKLGTSRENLYRILNGNPTLDNLTKVANALDIPLWQLFSGSGNGINGFVEYQGVIHRIQTEKDLEKLLSLIKST